MGAQMYPGVGSVLEQGPRKLSAKPLCNDNKLKMFHKIVLYLKKNILAEK